MPAAAVALAVAAVVGAPNLPAGAEADSWEYLSVDISGHLGEDSGPAVVTVTSACVDEITWDYSTGRRAEAKGSDTVYQESFDGRGATASPGLDFTPVSGTFTLSKSRPFNFKVPIIDDGQAEGMEHVPVLFRARQVASVFVGGEVHHCTAPDGDGSWQYVESAFTILDNEPSSAGGAPAIQPRSPVPPAERDTASASGASRTPTASRLPVSALSSQPKRPATADGLELLGAEVPQPRARGGDGDQRGLLVGALPLTVVAAGGTVLVRRRRW